MRHLNWILVPYCLTVAICGCNSDSPPSSSQQPSEIVAPGVRAEEIVGKWHLVRAGGKPPIELYIKSQEIDIAKDGTWTAKIEVQPPQMASDRFMGQGTWSLADGVMSYEKTSPQGVMVIAGSDLNSGKSHIRVGSGRLIVDPDFFMGARKSGTDPVAGEYER